jgi:hypothetical protein
MATWPVLLVPVKVIAQRLIQDGLKLPSLAIGDLA